MKIGLGITTRNRANLLWHILPLWKKSLHNVDAVIHVKIDMEEDTIGYTNLTAAHADIQFSAAGGRVGIAKAKNVNLAALLAQNCTHIFLVDDDIYPLRSRWWEIYTQEPFNHMGYFTTGKDRKPKTTKQACGVDSEIHQDLSGGLLYFTGRALELQYNPAYGFYGYEHIDMSRRCAAHCKQHPFIVPRRISEFFYSLDLDYNVQGYTGILPVENFQSSVHGEPIQSYIDENFKIYANLI
jgi:hypothetical protein